MAPVGRSECLALANRLAEASSYVLENCDCMLLSGGVDTGFLAASHPKPNTMTAVTVDLGGPDAGYASLAASRLGMGHVVLRPSEAMFLEALASAVDIVETIDPVEAAADAVHVLSAGLARALGCRCLATGDGGDEMFLGYSFLLDKHPEELREWQRAMAREAWLPTIHLARTLGLEARAPLYSVEAKRIALDAPLNCLVGLHNGRRWGKLLLRLYLEARGLPELAWRPKTPVTSGSGSLETLKRLAAKLAPEPRSLEPLLGFTPPSREHALLAKLLTASKPPPPPCRGDAGQRCPICGRCMTPRGHCRFCGAVKTPKGVTVYRGL